MVGLPQTTVSEDIRTFHISRTARRAIQLILKDKPENIISSDLLPRDREVFYFSRELNLVLGKGVMCVKNIVNWLSFPHLQITKSKLIGLPMTISVQLLTTLFLENYITSISNPPGLIPFWIRILSTFYLIPEFKLRKLKYQMNLHMNYPSQMMLSFHQIQFLSTNVQIL